MELKLEPDAEEIDRMMTLVTKKIIDHLNAIETPVSFDIDEARKRALDYSESMPEEEIPLEELLDDLFERRIPYSLHTTSPGFMAYIPGGGIFHAAMANLIASVTNRYVGKDFSAPFLAQIEADVLRWFCHMVGFPSSSGGTLTSGGSIANLTAVVCARTLVLGEDFSKGTVYASQYTHHSMWKAFHAAGIPSSQIRNIAVDSQFRLDTESLEKAIDEDKARGLTPLMIVANAGSTNTGTVDALSRIADIAKKNGAWYHIDAAYGGFFMMTLNGKERMRGMERADSITLDPHKGLFLPYGTGALIVRDRDKLNQVFSHHADYIPDSSSDIDLWDFSEMSLELSRPFRGLGVWLPFKMVGAAVFREALEEKLELATYFHQSLKSDQRWEIVASPELSITVFRYVDSRKTKEELNRLNQRVMDGVNRKFRTNISGTLVNGDFVIRSCILSFRTHKQHLDWLLEDLNDALDRVLSESNGGG